MAQVHEKTEVPNLLTSENVNLEVSSTIQPAGESEASLQEAENACEMQCDQNPVLSPKRANEHETHKPQRKQRKKLNKRSLTDACEVTTSASHLEQILSESEHTDTETTQHSKIDNKTTDYFADTEDVANFQKSTSGNDNLEDAVGDDHSPKSTDKNQMPDSYSSVKEEPNSGLESSKSGIIPSENEDQGAIATVEKPAPHPQKKKSTDSKEGIILTLEKQKENNGNVESAKEVHGGKSEAAKDNAGSDLECTGASKEKICNQQNTKKEESIPLTKQRKKLNKRSLTDACEVTTSASHLEQILSESEHTDTETTQHSKIDNKTTDYFADTEDVANFQKSTSGNDNLEDAVGDDHSPKSTDKNQMPHSHSSVKEEPNSGLESSKSGIIPSENEDQGAIATVEKPAPHPQKKKSTDSKEGIILTLEKQKENNGNVESAKEVHGGKSEAAKDNAGSDLECTGASKEKICNQQNTKKEESIPLTKRKKLNKRSLTDACEVTISASHLEQILSESEHTDTETTQQSKIDNKTTDYFADTEDVANFQKSTSGNDNLEDAVGDDHSPKSMDKNQMPDSYSSVKEEPNSGLESSKSGIIPSENEDQGAIATVEKPAPHPQKKKSTDSKEGIILTLEKQKENNGNVESAKEVHGGKSEAAKDNAGSDLECTGASKEKICNQQNTKKEESIPLTKGEDSGTDNKKKRLQQSEKKRPEQECKTAEEKHIDKPSESPKQESNKELSMTTISNSAAADKTSLSRKEKKQQKKHSKEITSVLSYTNLKPEEMVSIYFHAILSKDFKFNPCKDKVFIRSGSLADDWDTNILEMNVTKDLGEHGYLIEGCHSVHKDKIQKQHPYKYAVIRDNIMQYEFIYKSDSPKDCIINRCLVINQHFLYEREWHQYDDIICAPHDKGWADKLLDFIRSEKNDIKRGKQLAGEIMVDSIFDILTPWNEKNLKNFLRQLRQFYEVYKNPMVFERRPVTWFSLSFGMKDVQDILKDALKKMARRPNNQVSETKTHDVQSRLRTGILILVLSEAYGLEWLNSELAEVCDFFSVQQLSANIITVEFKTLKESFYFEQRITTILKQMMVRCIDNKIIGWVQVIPVLHLFGFSSNIVSPIFFGL
ncbi:E3 ubiquitin-protein ligase rnf213-alpha-like [Amblyraja radiata]|uniref:E3 ubiquitin-protein ligase rnf213-alpha-like n=1 Tax=Amblyraja radiata TaxID=386614 RepID=UPI0014022C3F|nr:E3 ubiquitin-protein ligase rnf213-alpha-like [Amblyraja radiata]